MLSSSTESKRWMKGTTQWSWATSSLKKSREALSSWWSTVCFMCSLFFSFMRWKLQGCLNYFSFHSASPYNWERGGCGHWCDPLCQEPHIEVHRTWISYTCTHPVAVDVQGRLPGGLLVGQHSSTLCMCACACSFLHSGSGHMLLSYSLSWCWQKQDRLFTKTRDETMRVYFDPDADKRMWFIHLTISSFRRTVIHSHNDLSHPTK